MNISEIRDLLDQERKTLARQGEVLEVLQDVTRLNDSGRHEIIYSKLNQENADNVIAREIAHYKKLECGFEWKVYSHDNPPNLRDKLKKAGFEVGELEAVLVLDLTIEQPWIHAKSSYTTKQLANAEDVNAYQKISEEIFQKDYSFTSRALLADIQNQAGEHLGYLGFADTHKPVSIGRLYLHHKSKFAGLFGGATHINYRRQGIYQAVVAARARDAIEFGAKYLIVDAMPTSRPILERLGFKHISDTWPCELTR